MEVPVKFWKSSGSGFRIRTVDPDDIDIGERIALWVLLLAADIKVASGQIITKVFLGFF